MSGFDVVGEVVNGGPARPFPLTLHDADMICDALDEHADVNRAAAALAPVDIAVDDYAEADAASFLRSRVFRFMHRVAGVAPGRPYDWQVDGL